MKGDAVVPLHPLSSRLYAWLRRRCLRPHDEIQQARQSHSSPARWTAKPTATSHKKTSQFRASSESPAAILSLLAAMNIRFSPFRKPLQYKTNTKNDIKSYMENLFNTQTKRGGKERANPSCPALFAPFFSPTAACQQTASQTAVVPAASPEARNFSWGRQPGTRCPLLPMPWALS